MSKKLLSEAQVRKFMGLANLDANLSSNFLNEMYGKEEEMEEAYHKRDDEVMKEEEEMEMDAEADIDMPDAAPEGGEDLGDADGADVELDEEEVQEASAAMEKIQAVLSKLMGGTAPEMDEEPPAEEPEMEMDAEMEMDEEEPEMMEDVNLQLSEDEIVQEVAKRVAKRINEAARAQKKADRLLGRKK